MRRSSLLGILVLVILLEAAVEAADRNHGGANAIRYESSFGVVCYVLKNVFYNFNFYHDL